MYRNERKPLMLAFPGVYKNCNISASHWYDDSAFDDVIEESENKVIVQKSLQPVPSQGIVEQTKKYGELRPQQGRAR